MKKRTAIDIGASSIRVLPPQTEEIAVCPSIAALECGSGKPLCFGYEAKLHAGRMPGSIDTVWPLLEPESVTSTVLEGLFACAAELAHPSGRFRTDLVLAIPGSIGEEQEVSYPEAASANGAKDVYIVSALHAAARGVSLAGVGLTAVIHVGASVAEIGIFHGDECLTERTVAVGGRTYDDLLGDLIYDRFGLLLDAEGAEKAKIALSLLPAEENELRVFGTHRRTGLPKNMVLDARPLREELRAAYSYLIAPLLEMVSMTGEAPAKAILTGGSAPICGLRESIADALPDTQVVIAPDPAEAVIRGLGAMIQTGDI